MPPVGSSLLTNAELWLAFCVVSSAPGVVGKSVDWVRPVMYAAPVASTAIAQPLSDGPDAPPMNVE